MESDKEWLGAISLTHLENVQNSLFLELLSNPPWLFLVLVALLSRWAQTAVRDG